MAKQKLQAGAELDILTKQEMASLLREWMVDVARGARPVQIGSQAQADANNVISVGGTITPTGGTLGPKPGFWWAVTRLSVRVDSVPAAFSLYINEAHSHSHVRDIDGSANGYAAFGNNELLIGGSDQLLIRASGTSSTSIATVTGSAIEFPETLLWKWTAG